MCLKCREKVIYKVLFIKIIIFNNMKIFIFETKLKSVVCLLSIYLFRKRQFIIILNKMKTFILRTKFKSNLCRLSIFCNMREKLILSPPFSEWGAIHRYCQTILFQMSSTKRNEQLFNQYLMEQARFFWTWKSLIGIRFHRAED